MRIAFWKIMVRFRGGRHRGLSAGAQALTPDAAGWRVKASPQASCKPCRQPFAMQRSCLHTPASPAALRRDGARLRGSRQGTRVEKYALHTAGFLLWCFHAVPNTILVEQLAGYPPLFLFCSVLVSLQRFNFFSFSFWNTNTNKYYWDYLQKLQCVCISWLFHVTKSNHLH